MTCDEIKDLFVSILRLSNADETFVVFHSSESESFSLASDFLNTPAAVSEATAQISIRIGDRYGSIAGNRFDEASIKEMLSRVSAMVSRMPPSQQILHYEGAADIPPSQMTDMSAARDARKWRLQHAQRIMSLAVESGYEMSCSLTTSRISTAVGSSNGLFACQPSTQAHCKALVYAPKRSAVGISEGRSFRLSEVDPTALTERALETARASLDPQEIKAGRMTVILEAQALAELLLPIMRQFDQQAVDDNRSFLRKLDGSAHLGSEMFAKTVTVRSDPYDAATPSAPFTPDGQKLVRRDWIRDGVVVGLTLSRSAALQKQSIPTPFPTNFIMEGGGSTIEELIASTEHGLLVRGFGPVLIEDPGNCMLNASTRGGLFLIESGKVSHACSNLVLQETGVHLLRHIEALTKPTAVQPHGVYFPLLLPAVKVAEVNFAGLSGTI